MNGICSIAPLLQHHLRCRQRHAFISLAATSVCVFTFIKGEEDDHSSKNIGERQLDLLRSVPSFNNCRQLCKCEEKIHSNNSTQPVSCSTHVTASPKPLSRLTLLLYASKLYPYSKLPIPRLLTPDDPIFSYPELKRGLIRRRKDEEQVKQILSSPEVIDARKNHDQLQLTSALEKMNCVVYGEGITPQMREDFMMKYGCTGYTDDILDYMVHAYKSRGIIEVGSGNGQWARSLNDHYQKQQTLQQTIKSSYDFILAYDNMEQLPLSPRVYHDKTLPANKYFYNKVQQASHLEAVQNNSRGRVLLLVYPPPGSMAIETVHTYCNKSPGYSGSYKNDTIVYVGEGRGGANANDAFFDYFLGCNDGISVDSAKKEENSTEKSQWILEKVMPVRTCPGGKGYEKMFVFKRSTSD